MATIKYNPQLGITNTSQLAKGTGAKYLEVVEPHEIGLPLIAVGWRKSIPKSLPSQHRIVEFSKRR